MLTQDFTVSADIIEYMFHVIDDEPMIRDLLEAFVSAAGYRAVCFESGEQYLQYLDSSKFEKPIAILSDVTMPGIHGYNLALEIRQKHPFQKIVLITGNASDERHQRAAQQLCYTLDKPFHPEKLVSMIEMLAACENAHETGDKTEYHQRCEFGIEHDCPFHSSKRLNQF